MTSFFNCGKLVYNYSFILIFKHLDKNSAKKYCVFKSLVINRVGAKKCSKKCL